MVDVSRKARGIDQTTMSTRDLRLPGEVVQGQFGGVHAPDEINIDDAEIRLDRLARRRIRLVVEDGVRARDAGICQHDVHTV